MNRIRPTTQIYSQYTAADQAVWKTLFERQMAVLRPLVAPEYLQALDSVGFSADRIPDFEEVNRLLKPLTGWSLQVVPCISPQEEFFHYLSNKQFTATCWLRTMEELDYLEEPDMFHDVFAHVPLLSNPAYVAFFKGLSDIALRYLNHPEAIRLLGNIYWFTIEFGLIRSAEGLKIYGAGIISSKKETEHSLSPSANHYAFDVAKIFATEYSTDVVQESYFVIDSFEQLYASLPEIERLIQYRLAEIAVFEQIRSLAS